MFDIDFLFLPVCHPSLRGSRVSHCLAGVTSLEQDISLKSILIK